MHGWRVKIQKRQKNLIKDKDIRNNLRIVPTEDKMKETLKMVWQDIW